MTTSKDILAGNNGVIAPTTEDINAVLNMNEVASLQLQVQMLSRTIRERDALIADLRSRVSDLEESDIENS